MSARPRPTHCCCSTTRSVIDIAERGSAVKHFCSRIFEISDAAAGSSEKLMTSLVHISPLLFLKIIHGADANFEAVKQTWHSSAEH